MAVQTPPKKIQIGGVWTKGSPLDRPLNSSIRCRNFRIMPPSSQAAQPWLRLRAGRKIRVTGAGGSSFLYFYEFRQADSGGIIYNICLRFDGSNIKWQSLASNYSVSDILTFGGSAAGAIATVRTKAFMSNGLGTRSGTSLPAFSSWDGTTVRYVGLDAFCPTGSLPSASFAAGAGLNTIISFVSIYVGLFNSTTQHCSNGVFAGTLSTPGTGTITVSNLANLTPSYNNSTEQGELFYVFYASIDGGQTAYQILNSALNGPFKVAISATSASLSISNLSTAGFVLDLTQERPIENYPPRPMSAIAYANGRVYGVLSGGGSGTAVSLPDVGGVYYQDFTYLESPVETGSIAWSAAADDATNSDFVGVPEESWPIRNRKATPNSEMPQVVDSAPGGGQVLVITTNGTFLLYEAADGLHQWITVSETEGTIGTKSYVRTPRGPMWLTQKKQLVLLDATTFTLQKLSEGFDDLLGSPLSYGATGACADYLWDPHNQIDRYEVWRTDGSSVIYDFALGGMAYESTGPVIGTAKTIFNPLGNRVHLMAGQNLYTQEVDPSSGLLSTRDELSTGVFTEISGDWISQWLNFGDPRNHERFTDLDVIGDGAVSAELSDSPITFTYYVDLDGTIKSPPAELTKSLQSATDSNYKVRMHTANFFWLKLRIQMAGHGGDGVTSYPEASSYDGEVVPPVYGSIFDIAPTVAFTGNRP